MEGRENGFHPPGVVALPCGDSYRSAKSALDLAGVRVPPSSRFDMRMGMDVSLALNTIVRVALEDPEAAWVWFQADDHLYDDDLLLRLLDREVDVVVPLIRRRNPPYDLVIYKGEGVEITEDGIPTANYELFDAEEIPSEGLLPVHAAGSGGMLVRRRVLEAIDPPWFESSSGAFVNDDLEFCRKVRMAGFEIHADVEAVMGHVSQYVVRPERRNDIWGITLDFGDIRGDNVIWFGEDPRKVAERQAELAGDAR